ncbi:fibrobacter succinogenes major paralogous domain-containing protein [Fibrobacter sp. UBA4297]|uniref:fibrobacter succinogenes major paralogous domain-containing protein n=1 Tax=Fibrobacter sp. UBA4297 TaxID=1946536 RepID=UPI0025C2B0AC|nr:fibrobacter succinogenes major paralogous domain-containing protein [Fibrobacter sp. UBA4297]
MLTKTMMKWNLLAALVFGTSFWACSGDKTAGTDEQSEGLYAIKNLDIAGVSQKGPFVKGSAVTVQGIDCKTMEFTDEVFEGEVKNNMGEFVVEKVNLSTTCAVVEVTGEYRSEMTGKKVSDKLTLRALTNLKDRTHVNVNLLTNLEYERVMYYVAEKGKSFDEAKDLAEREVLAAFGMAGESAEFEDLDIFGTSDADATLLAISVLMQGDADVKTLTERMDKFNGSFAESGTWNDDDTKKAIIDWIANAVAKAVMDSIRKNMENWGFANEVPDFEKVIEMFGADSTMTDSRDGQIYKTVKIGDQIWMAENLNFEVDSSYCYNDSAKYCTKYGRLYSWAAANRACPDGWHLPTIDEFETLFATVGKQSIAGKKLKSTSGWNNDGNGTDDFGFTALPAGIRYGKDKYYNYEGHHANFWSSIKNGSDSAEYVNMFYDYDNARQLVHDKNDGMSVRCLKGEAEVPSGWSWDVPKDARLSPNIKYDSMVDPRDKQVYKVVKIDVPDTNYSQVWMAENLNYADSVKTPSLKGRNWCYNDDEKNCNVSGRYYSWAAAIDSVALANDSKEPLDCGYGKKCGLDRAVQGICPEGWHLPTLREWSLLCEAIGDYRTCGEPLKALTGWNYAGTPNNNGTDLYGFAALPTGRRISATSWEKVGSDVYYWSSTEQDDDRGRYFNINNIYTQTYTYQNSKYYGQSVRCVKGDPSTAPVRPSSSSSKNDE